MHPRPDQPVDLEVLADRRPFERVAAIAVALTLAMIWVRLVWLWLTGVIRSEAFLGSTGWKVAIAAPGLIWLGAWLVSSFRLRRTLARRLYAVTSREPLMTWHRSIARFDWWLEPGLPVDVSSLVREITNRYKELDDQGRWSVRALWRAYPFFAAVAGTGEQPTSVEAVRRALMLYSIRDQRPDARDEVVALGELAALARRAGIDVAPLAREAAMLSDGSGEGQMLGSTRDVLLRHSRN
jgi:hypothetical protein